MVKQMGIPNANDSFQKSGGGEGREEAVWLGMIRMTLMNNDF